MVVHVVAIKAELFSMHWSILAGGRLTGLRHYGVVGGRVALFGRCYV